MSGPMSGPMSASRYACLAPLAPYTPGGYIPLDSRRLIRYDMMGGTLRASRRHNLSFLSQ